MLGRERPKVAAANSEPDTLSPRRRRQHVAARKPVSAARAVPEPYQSRTGAVLSR